MPLPPIGAARCSFCLHAAGRSLADRAAGLRRRGVSGGAVIAWAARRTSAITVPVGNRRTCEPAAHFVDISVGDAEIADVNPLTDQALSIPRQEARRPRVSIYGEGG